MLSQREKDFIRYWEANRLRRKKAVIQFLIGIPVGLLFVIPIVINFSSGWYKRADMEAHSADFNPTVLLIALLLILGFTAIFYQRHKWDQYEQRYQELLARQRRDEEGAGNYLGSVAAESDRGPGIADNDRRARTPEKDPGVGAAECDIWPGAAENDSEKLPDDSNGPKGE